jgi:hypothetical protein
MKIELERKTKAVIVVVLLVIIGWWWLHSWAAYRNVEPPTDLTKPEIQAWFRGTCDMTAYMVFHNYPVILWCAAALGLVALIPERRSR